MQEAVDVIVIGSGQAGPSLAVRMAGAGYKTVLIEREHVGGTCLNDGCTPTKALIASARVAHLARIGASFGVIADKHSPVAVDMKIVRARKDELVDRLVGGLTEHLEGTEGLSLIRGEARFVSAHTIEVGSQHFTAPLIFINVGGRPSIPPIEGLEDVPYLTNTSMMQVDFLPEHLAIVGGSYVALEFAQMYRRFGSQVTILERGDRLVPREDPDISLEVQSILEAEGIDVYLNAQNLAVHRGASSGCVVTFEGHGDTEIEASHLLVATGRTPNADRLNLEAAGIRTTRNGTIEVDEQLETNVSGVYALGDVNGRGAFTHTAYNDYEIVAAHLLEQRSRNVSDRIATYALYIDPPLGRAGMTEAEVRASGRKALIATMPMSRVGRARERSETQGFMKVLVDAESKHILGAALLGIEADEVVQVLLLAMNLKVPFTVITDMMGIHPTVAELLPTLFASLRPLEPA